VLNLHQNDERSAKCRINYVLLGARNPSCFLTSFALAHQMLYPSVPWAAAEIDSAKWLG
jgi:hypothetical protein